MAKCYCSYKKCTSNIKRKISSKILKESGTIIHFKLLFHVKLVKLEKFHPNFSNSELEFLLLA